MFVFFFWVKGGMGIMVGYGILNMKIVGRWGEGWIGILKQQLFCYDKGEIYLYADLQNWYANLLCCLFKWHADVRNWNAYLQADF